MGGNPDLLPKRSEKKYEFLNFLHEVSIGKFAIRFENRDENGKKFEFIVKLSYTEYCGGFGYFINKKSIFDDFVSF